jgi:hypothetical protein
VLLSRRRKKRSASSPDYPQTIVIAVDEDGRTVRGEHRIRLGSEDAMRE